MLTTLFHSFIAKSDFVKDVLFVITANKHNRPNHLDLPLLITEQHRWKFRIHPSLTPVLEIKEFKMLRLLHICDNNITMSYYKQKHLFPVILCGKHSNITIFGKTHAISVHMYFRLQHMFAFTASFDMMSTGVAMTDEFSQRTFDHISRTVHRIHLEKISESVFSIYVMAKKLYIVGLRPYTNAMWSRMFDGPGILSPYHDNPSYHLSDRLSCSTFQCILEMRSELKNPVGRLSGAYVFKMLSMKNWAKRFIVEGRVHVEQVSILNCVSACFYIFRFETPVSSHVTIAVNNLSFHGPEDFACRYGGIGFYDFEQITMTSKEVDTFCSKKQNYFDKKKNIHSSGPDMVVVAFAYEYYSSLQVYLNVTSTSCQIIELNLCPVAQKHLNNLLRGEFGSNQDKSSWQKTLSMLSTLSGADLQTFPRSTIYLSSRTCFLVKIFTKFFSNCEIAVGDRLPFINCLFGTYLIFKSQQKNEILYDFVMEGVLISKGELSFSEKSGHAIDTELIISGPLHDHKICNRTSTSEWKDNKRTKHHGLGLTTMCIEAKRTIKMSDEPKDFNPILSLVSPYNGHLYFSTQHVSRAVFQKHTLSFRILYFGFDSWVDFFILPSEKNPQDNHIFLPQNSPINLPVVHPEKVLLFSQDMKHKAVGNTELHIMINSKVSHKATVTYLRQMCHCITVQLLFTEC